MTTRTLINTTAISFLMLLMAVPVFAQTEDVASSTPTEPWYKVEQLSGDIDVGDFVVGPGRSEVQLQPGQTYVQEITVTNRISDDREFRLEVEDITGSSDGSSAVALTGAERGPYSIRDFISFPKESFILKLGERARIPVTITVPPNAEPGGYYGSVLVSTVQPSVSSNDGAPRSPIIARVGSLIFLTVGGDTVRAGATKSIGIVGDSSFFQAGPIDFSILFENTGSVHTNPYGEVSITNMFGEEVGFLELEPWFVLPKSLRSREVSWNREFLLGRYEVTARINRGYDDVVDEVTTSFWVLPWKFVGGSFAALFILIFLIRLITKNFEFKRKE